MKPVRQITFLALVLLALAAIITSCSTATRKPANDGSYNDKLRTAVYDIPDEKGATVGHRLIILGIDRTGNAGDGARFDLGSLGFHGKEISAIDPKFLLIVNKFGVQSIRSFELGGFNRDTNPATDKSRALPPELLDAAKPRKAVILQSITKGILAAAKMTVLAPLSAIFQTGRKESEDRKKTQAAYLETLVEFALEDSATNGSNENSLAALKEVLTPNEIKELGAALTVRFHPSKEYGGLFASAGSRVKFYDILMDIRSRNRTEKLETLMRVSNEQGLVVFPFTDRFALLFYDRKNQAPKDHWKSFLIHSKHPEEEAKFSESVSFEAGSLVPMGIFSLDEKHAPLDMINFRDIGEIGRTERMAKLVEAAKNIGYAFLPMSYITMGIRVLDGGISFVLAKKGKTIFDSRVRSYGELAAITETGIAKFDIDEIVLEAFAKDLEILGMDPEKVTVFRERLKSRDTQMIKTTLDEIISILSSNEEKKGRLFGAPSEERVKRNKAIHLARLKNFIADPNKLRQLDERLDKRTERQERKPSSLDMTQAKAPLKPVIVFMIDGMRPDRLRNAAADGLVPNLKSLVIDRGAELDSYVSRSLTLPSWATILTGYEPDEHGLKSNTPAARRKGGSGENWQDFRKDILLPKYMTEGRSYRRLKESGLDWLPSNYNEGEALITTLPINNGAQSIAMKLLHDGMKHIPEIGFGIYQGFTAFDRAISEGTAATITAFPGKHRLVVNWFTAIDEQSHLNNRSLARAFTDIDAGIGKVLAAAKADPVLKDAVVVVVSDHGHSAGMEAKNSSSVLSSKRHFLNNTGFNLTTWFGGDYVETKDYRFVVGASESPKPEFDLGFLREFMIQPFYYTYTGRHWNDGIKAGTIAPKLERSILVDYAGDKLAQIYVRKNESWEASDGIGRRLSHYELTHYTNAQNRNAIDIPGDLFKYESRNVEAIDAEIRTRIKEVTGNRPVGLFAMALAGEAARTSADGIGAGETTGVSQRDPVLVRGQGGKAALILTRRNLAGEDEFRYVVVKDFNQDESGRISGTASTDSNDDPLRYIGTVDRANDSTAWRTDREWLSAAKNSSNPTAIYTLVRALTLSPRIATVLRRQAELPDFVLIANPGFAFHSSVAMESDHGGLEPSEVRNSFYISGIGAAAPARAVKIAVPVMSRDVTPTILDYAGARDAARSTQGISFKPTIESALQEN